MPLQHKTLDHMPLQHKALDHMPLQHKALDHLGLPHGYSLPEKEILFADYGKLAELATQFLTALIAFLEAPADVEVKI